MAELREKQNKGAKWTGIGVRSTKVIEMFKQGVLDPLVVKEQIIKSATEVALMLLRIDDVIAGGKSKNEKRRQRAKLDNYECLLYFMLMNEPLVNKPKASISCFP